MYCKICNKPCCLDCIAKEHANHAFTNFEDAAEDVITDIQTYIGILETIVLPSIEKLRGDIAEGKEKYNEALKKVTEDSKRRFRNIRDELDRAEKDWMQQLDAITKADHSEMDRLENDVEEKLKQIKNLTTTCKTAVTESSEIDLLSLKHKFQAINDLELGAVSMPALVRFLPSTYKIPEMFKLVGRIQKENMKIGIEKFQSRASAKGDALPFDPSMVLVTSVKTHNVKSHSVLITTDGICINNRDSMDLTLYNENIDRIKTVPMEFKIRDMALASTNDIIVSDFENKRLVRIFHSGGVTKLCSTRELEPWGLCINDKQQIVVGLRRGHKTQPIKLSVYSSDGSALLQEMEKDKSGKPLFTKAIYQVKQNGNGDHVVADYDRIVCVSREGEYRWEYQVEGSGEWIPQVIGMVCDRYNNIIIAEWGNDKIRLLDSEGKLVTTLMTRGDGIIDPLSLAIDKQGHLWIGQSGNLKVVKYIR